MAAETQPALPAFARLLQATGAALAVGGCAFLLANILMVGVKIRFLNSAVRTQGVVTRIFDQRTGSALGRGREQRLYFPEIAYTDQNGFRHVIETRHGSTPPRHRVGDAVAVAYSPLQPERAVINEFRDLWLNHAFFLALSLGCALIGWRLRVMVAREYEKVPAPPSIIQP